MRGSQRFASFVAWTFGVAVVLGLWHRFHYAAELTDESFSVALPYRFVLGDRPFVDEVNVAQTAGLVIFPFVWLYVKLTGGSAGLVLFCRGLHLVVKGVAALAVHSAARRWVSPPSAIACAVVAFGFVPHSIPNAGYNVLGSTLLLAGGFAAAAGISRERPDDTELFLGGLASGLATFAYPTIAPAPVLAALLVLVCAPTSRFRAMGVFVLGGIASFLLVSPALAFGGVAGVKETMRFTTEMVPRGASKLTAIYVALKGGAPELLVYGSLALVAVRLVGSRFLTALVVPVVVAAAALWFRKEAGTYKAGLDLVTFTGLLAPAMVFAVSADRVLLRAGVLIALPSMVAGFATAWGSSNGPESACLGLWPAAVLVVVLAVAALERAHAERLWTMAPAVLFTAILVLRTYEFVYRDAPLEALTTRITSGPFRGIHTTASRAGQLAELERVTRAHDREGGRLLVLYEQPGVSLFSRMRPGSNTVWPVAWYDQERLLAYWRAHVTGRGMVIRVGNGVGKLVDPAVEAPERVIDKGSWFVVYRE